MSKSPVPFGGGSYADFSPGLLRPNQCQVSPVPFGGGSYADANRDQVLFRQQECLQCLSAVGPMRTRPVAERVPAVVVRSPVPFGGGSYADRRVVRVPLVGARIKSPVPFGGGSYADQTLWRNCL